LTHTVYKLTFHLLTYYQSFRHAWLFAGLWLENMSFVEILYLDVKLISEQNNKIEWNESAMILSAFENRLRADLV